MFKRVPRKLKKARKVKRNKWMKKSLDYAYDIFQRPLTMAEIIPPRTEKEQAAFNKLNNIFTRTMTIEEMIDLYPMTNKQVEELKKYKNDTRQ
jgi:hypothetical protein